MGIRAIAVLFFLLLPAAAQAMTFQVIQKRDGSQPDAIFGSGPIVSGDAERLAEALALIPYRPGPMTKGLFLSSLGGSVAEAFRMAEVIDRVGITAVVPPDKICASACTILFIGSRYRMIHKGLLGFHSCYDGVTGEALEMCNADMATFATKHGVPYGSVYSFTQYIAPTSMTFLDSDEARCWGITRSETGLEEGHGRCIDEMIADLFKRCGKDGRITEEQMDNCALFEPEP